MVRIRAEATNPRSRRFPLGVASVALLLSCCSIALGEEPVSIRVAAWNMEGNGKAATNTLKAQLAEKEGIDLWGLCEVHKDRFNAFLAGAAEGEQGTFRIIKGTTGGPKVRLAIIYNEDVLEQIGQAEELHFVAVSSGLRAPLVARFRGRQSGQEFWFMVNHLKCCGDGLQTRIQQCNLISSWAESQDVPVLMCGDLNIPFDLGTASAGPDFDALVEDGQFVWLQPEHLTKTQASDSFNSVLDYFMVANAAPLMERWTFNARILDREGDDPVEPGEPNDFDDDDTSTDHRPIDVILTMVPPSPLEAAAIADENPSSADQPSPSLEDLLERIRRLEGEVERLRNEHEGRNQNEAR